MTRRNEPKKIKVRLVKVIDDEEGPDRSAVLRMIELPAMPYPGLIVFDSNLAEMIDEVSYDLREGCYEACTTPYNVDTDKGETVAQIVATHIEGGWTEDTTGESKYVDIMDDAPENWLIEPGFDFEIEVDDDGENG